MNNRTFELKRLGAGDLSTFRSLVNLFNLVFEEVEPTTGSDTALTALLGNKSFVALAAVTDSEVVGGLTAYELPMYYSDVSEILLYDMAVKEDYQRMGIGKSLLDALREYCVRNGVKEFFVLAHEEDEHAMEFYHSTGGKDEKVVSFVYEAAVAKG